MPSIINFGSPRSGTTFVGQMFFTIPSIKSYLGLSKKLPHTFDDSNKLSKIVEKFFNGFNKNNIYHTKLGENTIMHPINFQTEFDKFCNRFPKPLILVRTYRHPVNIYKSLLFKKGKINMIPRFNTWTRESVAAMILSEYSGYLAIKNDYDIISLDFDNKESMIKSISDSDFFGNNIKDHCINFIENNYNKVYVRSGIRSKKVTMDISRSDELYFENLSNILKKLKESL